MTVEFFVWPIATIKSFGENDIVASELELLEEVSAVTTFTLKVEQLTLLVPDEQTPISSVPTFVPVSVSVDPLMLLATVLGRECADI